MSDTKTVYVNSFPVMGLLGVLFVGLKLTGYITWSWWWVTAPFWGPAALALSAFLLVLLFAGIFLLIAAILGK